MKNKERLNKLKKGYTKIMTDAFRMGLNASEVGVYCYLCSMPEEFHPSVRHLANTFGCGKSTIAKALARLKELGMIEVEERGAKGTTTKYRLTFSSVWRKNAVTSDGSGGVT